MKAASARPTPVASPETMVRARFGLPMGAGASVERREQLRDRARRAARSLLSALAPGRVALVLGPSGSGKSMILGELGLLAPGSLGVRHARTRSEAPVIETLRSPMPVRLRLLSSAGLADAQALVTPARLLSEGQHARLALARTFDLAHRKKGPALVLADEFCSALDRLTARSVCLGVRRLMPARSALVCASAHDDLIEWLVPDVLVYVPLEGEAEITRRGRS